MDIRGSVVMVVDDEDPVREKARLALEAEGLVVLTARNGVEALLLAERHGGPIHLLLTDLSMPPYMDGLELARSLRGVRPGLRVLFLSACGHLSTCGHEVPAPADPDPGATSLVSKPFTSESLVERVRAALAGPDAEAAPAAPTASRTILILVPEDDVRASVASLLREEGYRVLEARNIGDSLAISQWHGGGIGLLLADRETWTRLPSEYRERVIQARPGLRILCASVDAPVTAPLGERVRRALEEWGLEAQGGS